MKLAEMEQKSLKRMNVAWQPEAEQNLILYSSLRSIFYELMQVQVIIKEVGGTESLPLLPLHNVKKFMNYGMSVCNKSDTLGLWSSLHSFHFEI